MQEQKSILSRAFVVFIPLGLLTFAIFFKLISIQFIEGPELRERAEKEVIKEMRIEAERGNIYSADGKLLATSMPVYDLHFDPISVAEDLFYDELDDLCEQLAKFPGERSAAGWRTYLVQGRNKGKRYLALGEKLSYNQLQIVKAYPIFKEGKYSGGLVIEQENHRKMPLGKIAERTIGRERENFATGLEGAYASYLQGKDGQRLKQKISQGNWKPLYDLNEIEPVDGYDLVSTIDTRMQDIAHHALLEMLEYQEADHGCAVVMDVKTGAIKAIANLGRTDVGTYFEKRNYAVWESTEPGSTFKLASVLALFEDGYADLNTPVDTENGIFEYQGEKIKDSNGKGYGKTSLQVAFEKSSNVGIAKTVIDHYAENPQRFIDRLYSIGLDRELDLPIKGEGKARIPTVDDPDWSGISLPWISFGYETSFTPLQILSLYNAVANDGAMVKPRFLESVQEHGRTIKSLETEIINPSICSPETLQKLQVLLQGVVQNGTARTGANSVCTMAGKTGTCQLNYWKGGPREYQASFAGYFPADKPRYSCIVVVNKPLKDYYGSNVAFPVFQKIAEGIYRNTPQEVEPKNKTLLALLDPSNEGPKKLDESNMPNLMGENGAAWISIFENAGYTVRVTGAGRVFWQYPSPEAKLSKNQLIELKLQ
ncbi:MAG: penicillin-binding transpeptidase domain-containing protein [Bacteroidetes bacterium]|nr:penicillin-binding transpeptidase domain-containing protein [Bacteroidota bacterium]